MAQPTHIKRGLLVMLSAAVFFALMGAMILLPCVYLALRPVRRRFVVGA